MVSLLRQNRVHCVKIPRCKIARKKEFEQGLIHAAGRAVARSYQRSGSLCTVMRWKQIWLWQDCQERFFQSVCAKGLPVLTYSHILVPTCFHKRDRTQKRKMHEFSGHKWRDVCVIITKSRWHTHFGKDKDTREIRMSCALFTHSGCLANSLMYASYERKRTKQLPQWPWEHFSAIKMLLCRKASLKSNHSWSRKWCSQVTRKSELY